MVVIALIGLLLGVVVECAKLMRRRQEFLRLMKWHEKMEDNAWAMERLDRDMAEFISDGLKSGVLDRSNNEYPETESRSRATAVKAAQIANYHALMKRKYEKAASRPWITQKPDPPKPDSIKRMRN